MILRLAGAAADIDVLRGLQEGLHADQFGELRPQACDDLVGGGLAAAVLGLEAMNRLAWLVLAAADEDAEAGDGGILADDVGDLLDLLAFCLCERGVLRGEHDAAEEAGVLLREEAGGRGGVEHDRERDRRQEHHQGHEFVPQDDVERARIADLEIGEALLQRLGEPVRRRLRRLEELAAQHRRQSQREHERQHHRRAERDGEFPHQQPDHAAHEHQGREHRDQRDRDREDGEADFARAGQRRLERLFALLDPLPDHLHHDDGVVDHEADGDGHGHQRKIVEAEIPAAA